MAKSTPPARDPKNVVSSARIGAFTAKVRAANKKRLLLDTLDNDERRVLSQHPRARVFTFRGQKLVRVIDKLAEIETAVNSVTKAKVRL
jgi:hypothetical protein